MAEQLTLEAQARSNTGSANARRLRRTGRVPAVIYGGGEEQVMVSLERRVLLKEMKSARFYSTLCAVALDGKSWRVLPREIQKDPVTEMPLHADFIRATAGSTVTVQVPVVFDNEETCPGLRQGGVLNVVRREVELVCPVDAIPTSIHLDLAKAEIGDSLHISAVPLPEGVAPSITDRDFTVATIVAPTGVPSDEDEEGVERDEDEDEGEDEDDEG